MKSEADVREIAKTYPTLRAWADANGLKYSTAICRFHRAGVKACRVHRAERVRLTLAYAAEHGVSMASAAHALGWSSAQSFSRTKRMVRAA